MMYHMISYVSHNGMSQEASIFSEQLIDSLGTAVHFDDLLLTIIVCPFPYCGLPSCVYMGKQVFHIQPCAGAPGVPS